MWSYNWTATSVKWNWPLGVVLGIALATASQGGMSQAIPGGFGNGDPESIPSFTRAVGEKKWLAELSVPRNTPGGMSSLIPSLLSMAVNNEYNPRLQNAARIKAQITRGLDNPSPNPSRLFFVSSALALLGPGTPVVVLMCDICGTAALAMAAENKLGFVLSPQIELGGG